MTLRKCIGCGTAVMLLLCVGCAGVPRRAEIPIGTWSGEGTFVLEKWDAAETADAASGVLSQGKYKTHLTIEPTTLDGRDALRMEILSERGEVEGLDGDRTHIISILCETRSIENDTITFYRICQEGLSLDAEEPSMEYAPDEFTRATCLLRPGEVVLRIEYMDKLIDIYRFRGDTVLKDGTYGGVEAEGYVHWSERLRRSH